MRVGVVIPALNEERSVGRVVSGLLAQVTEGGDSIVDKVVDCDNGSSDDTVAIAATAGAQVVEEKFRGYGVACQKALKAIHPDAPDVVIFTDADNAFDPDAIIELLDQIHFGADLVIGSRTLGSADKGALSSSQRIGNRVATFLIGFLWGVHISDLGPYRAIRTSSLVNLGMRDRAFGWTVEMQVKAIQHGLNIREIPVDTHVRIGESKISGTLKGVVGAGIGILSTIFTLWYNERKN